MISRSSVLLGSAEARHFGSSGKCATFVYSLQRFTHLALESDMSPLRLIAA